VNPARSSSPAAPAAAREALGRRGGGRATGSVTGGTDDTTAAARRPLPRPYTSSPVPPTAVIIGAGPAGLAAAYELLDRTGVVPAVLEASDHMGGIARTVEYRGNRIDIGGHRFFSKSDRVMDWWQRFLPL